MESKLRILGQDKNKGKVSVSISTRPTKTSVRINSNGDQIDPETKEIIKRNTPDFTIATPNPNAR